MSWVVEEWKEGLPNRALQKVQELEGQVDRLKKERQQRQFQLEALEAALQKQKQKVEDEKTEGTNLKRENQSLMEACENLEKTRQKISHELQLKESQVNFQEGQLNSSRKQIEQLEQELRRCKSELERSQQLADASQNPSSTPQKVFTAPPTPSLYYSGSKYEELKEKYNKEVEERKRLEAEVKVLQTKRVSPAQVPASMNHRDIARHQASSSVFSWQQEQTPSRLHSSTQRTPLRRDISGDWETTPGRSALKMGQRDTSGSFCDSTGSSHALDQLKAQNQDLRSKITELELRLQGQEKELKNQGNKFQELQVQLEKAKAELAEREKMLTKSRDELTRTSAQFDQASAKSESLEQKLRKLTEDLSCQRQNAESARCSLEQKLREKEKEFQEELSRQQRAFQALDQEGTQMKARLTQELQQAKNNHNSLQAELDKVTSAKHQLEKSLEESKRNFYVAEQALQASQSKEKELQREGEDMKKELGLLRAQSEQRASELHHLEEELRVTQQGWSHSQAQAEELRTKNSSQEAQLRELQEKADQQENSLVLEKLKLALADLKTQWACSQDLLRKREHHIEQLNCKLITSEKESETLLSALESKKVELEALRAEEAQLSRWKRESEQLIRQVTSERDSLQDHVGHLQSCLKAQQITGQEHSERAAALEAASQGLRAALENRTMELEAQRQACAELQEQARLSAQEHREELEGARSQAAQLARQVVELEQRVQDLSGNVADREQRCQDLQAECTSLRSLLPPGGASPGAPENASGMGSWPDRVASLEAALEAQRQMNTELQKQCEELAHVRGSIDGDLQKAEQRHQSFVDETTRRISKLQEDAAAHQAVVSESLAALESKERELELLEDRLQAEQASAQELRSSNLQLEDALRELQVLSEAWGPERKAMAAATALKDTELAELSRRLTQQEEDMAELSARHTQERLSLLRRCEEASGPLEELRAEVGASLERVAQLEALCEDRQQELHRLEEALVAEQQAHSATLARAEERSQELRQTKASEEADGLRRKVRALEEARCGLQTEVQALQQENEQLRTFLLSEHEHSGLEPTAHGDPASWAPGDSCDGRTSLDAAPGAKEDPAPDGLAARVRDLEAQLLQSQQEQEDLRQKLQAGRWPPEDGGFYTDTESRDKVDGQGLPQVVVEQLAELQATCEVLRGERSSLLSQLQDSRAQCVLTTCRLAREVDRLVSQAQALGSSDGTLPKEQAWDLLQGQQVPMAPGSPECLVLTAEEVQAHFVGLQEKVASLQREQERLLERLCIAQQQSCADTSPGTSQDGQPGSRDVSSLPLTAPCPPGSPQLDRPVEASSCQDPEMPGDSSVWVGQPQAQGIREAPSSCLEELESLCQTYRQALQQLEEKVESEGRAREQRVRELEDLLGNERKALESLRGQQLAESEQWQQRLARVTEDLEAERRQTEQLGLELEAARLQLQGLDLSARSWLGTDLEEALRGVDDGADSEGQVSEAEQGIAQPGRPHEVAKEDALGPEREETAGSGDSSSEQGPGTSFQAPLGSHTQRGSEDSGDLSVSSPPDPGPWDLQESQTALGSMQQRLQEAEGEKAQLPWALRERELRLDSLLQALQLLQAPCWPQSLQDTFPAWRQLVAALREATESLQPSVDMNTEEDSRTPALAEDFELQENKAEDLQPSVDMNTEEDGTDHHEVSQALDPLESCELQEEGAKGLGDVLGLHPSEDMSTEDSGTGHHKDSQTSTLAKSSEMCKEATLGLSGRLSLLRAGSPECLHPSVDMSTEENGTDQDSQPLLEALDRRALPRTADLEPIRAEEAGESPTGQSACLQEEPVPCPEDRLPGLVSEPEEDKASEMLGEISRLQELLQNREDDAEDLRAQLGAAEQALVTALEEKAMATGRLNSTREEVRQLRAGMERLRERIEADERRRRAGERQRDALQDRLELLEHERQVAEEQQELAILDAESARAEAEALQAQLEGAAVSLGALQADKDTLVQQLQALQHQLSELEELLPTLRARLTESEQDRAQLEADSRASEERLCAQLQELGEEVVAATGSQQSQEAGVQSPKTPTEGVCWLREGVLALAAQLHASRQEQHQTLGKLKEVESREGLLQARVGELQKELEALGNIREHLLLEAEGSREEAEALRAEAEQMALQLRGLESELSQVRSEREVLTQDLEKERAQACSLEAHGTSLEQQLQEQEQEMGRLKRDSDARLQELSEELAALQQDRESWEAREHSQAAQVAALEDDKAQLQQGLQESEGARDHLQASLSALLQELEASKEVLAQREGEVAALSTRSHELKQQLAEQLSQAEEAQRLLEEQAAELKQKAGALEAQNQALQSSIQGLQESRADLEKELELARAETTSLAEQVTSSTTREAALKMEVQKLTEDTAELREEARRLAEELQSVAEEASSHKDQLKELTLENSKLKTSLDRAQQDQAQQEGKMREERAKAELQLQAAEQRLQTLLLDADSQHKMEIQTYREKLASQEDCLDSQKVELDLLKSEKQELSASLKATTERLEDLQRAQMDSLQQAQQLKKEGERAQGKVKLLIKSCRQLEAEKEALQKELVRLEATTQETPGAGVAASGASQQALEAEVKELQETLEEKSREVDQYLEKYCTLLISHEKLEKQRDMLESQVQRLSAQQPAQILQLLPTLSPDPLGPSPALPEAQRRPGSGQGKQPGKRQRPSSLQETGSVGTPATPETFSKKSRRSSRRTNPHLEDLEFEPEGLPEVVKKGFADIPTGKTSPYVVRRTTMGTRTSPRLAARAANKENLTGAPKSLGGSGRVLKVKEAQKSPVAVGAEPQEPERGGANSPLKVLQARRGRLASSPEVGSPGPGGNSSSNDNCRVQ